MNIIEEDTTMIVVTRNRYGFSPCCICGKEQEGNYWAHDDCWRSMTNNRHLSSYLQREQRNQLGVSFPSGTHGQQLVLDHDLIRKLWSEGR